jgi:hypothetical protein
MINPYATPRIQRLVPERTAAGMTRLMEEASSGPFMAAARRVARQLELAIATEVARRLLLAFAREDALVSGALPGEFDSRELRYEF